MTTHSTEIVLVIVSIVILLIGAGIIVVALRERKRWNRGVCAECGTNWEYDSGWPGEGSEYVCGCGQHHIHIGVYAGANQLPIPTRTLLLRYLDKLVEPCASQDRLLCVMRARTVLRDYHDYDGVDVEYRDGHVVFSRKRGTEFLKLTVGPLTSSLVTADMDARDLKTVWLSSELLPHVFAPCGFQYVAMLNSRVEHVHV